MTVISLMGHRPYRTKSDLDLEADRGWWLARKMDAVTPEDTNFAAMRLAEVEREQALRRRK